MRIHDFRTGVIAAGIIALASGIFAPVVQAQGPAEKLGKLKLSAVPEKTGRPGVLAKYRVAIQVNQNDKAVMDLALNNAKNIIEYYKEKGEAVTVEIVTYGPGLHMLRSDTSPVKERVAVMSLENPSLVFAACANTQANQSKAENKAVVLVGEATVTPSGVVRLMELQKKGYAYIRP